MGNAVALACIFYLWQVVFTHYDTPPLGFVLLSAGVAVGLLNKIPLLLWIWWAWGLLSVLWSLTPGNTLVLGLWELGYLGAFAGGSWLVGLVGLNIGLLGYGLSTTLALAWSGLTMYFSGSAHYVAGAQALALIPLAMVWRFRSRWPLLSGILLTGALYLALMSGARAVYLPLVIIVFLLVWRLWREGLALHRLGLGAATVVLAIAVVDVTISFSPVQQALGMKAAISNQIKDISAEGEGSIGSRILMWQQTLNIALREPMGTGNGSFKDVLAAYQQYPGILYGSAHNYYLETAATGGWPRLFMLLTALSWILWRGWRSPAWPWALGAAGIWSTLAFDVTGMHPAVMMLAFASLGAVFGQLSQPESKVRLSRVLQIAGAGLGIGLIAWWYGPCSANCALARHLGHKVEVLAILEKLSDQQKSHLLSEAARLNPKSLWVFNSQLKYTESPEEKIEILKKILDIFPMASPAYYLQLAELLVQNHQRQQALRVLKEGLRIFPTDFTAYKPGNFFGALDPIYRTWQTRAPELMDAIRESK